MLYRYYRINKMLKYWSAYLEKKHFPLVVRQSYRNFTTTNGLLFLFVQMERKSKSVFRRLDKSVDVMLLLLCEVEADVLGPLYTFGQRWRTRKLVRQNTGEQRKLLTNIRVQVGSFFIGHSRRIGFERSESERRNGTTIKSFGNNVLTSVRLQKSWLAVQICSRPLRYLRSTDGRW